jgi:hypothetical protein
MPKTIVQKIYFRKVTAPVRYDLYTNGRSLAQYWRGSEEIGKPDKMHSAV